MVIKRLPNFFNELSGVNNFSQYYDIDQHYDDFRFPQTEGIYVIALKDNLIYYPIGDSNIIYIGMSNSDISSRLVHHVKQNDRYGLAQYLERNDCIYYFCSSGRNLSDLEKEYLNKFEDIYGRIPICNIKRG